MAQKLQNITISAPGFLGINTQDSPIGLNPAYASVADNCVIDKSGRAGARNGYAYVTTDATAMDAGDGIEVVHEHTLSDGTTVVFSCGNGQIFSGTTTLTDITPVGYAITSNNWKVASFNQHCYFFQRGYEPLVYDEDAALLLRMSEVTGASGTPPQGHEVLPAYGRLWVADFANDKHTVYWSDLLNGRAWTAGSSGSIDINKHWPQGYDEITALAAHNGFLIIFGKRSLLVFQGAESPASMTLHDAIGKIGCVDRDTVQATGTDLVFLSETGVRSLLRTIQEKSAPLRDISRNVRNDLIGEVAAESSPIKSLYSPEKAFYLLSLRDGGKVYCFDLRAPLEDESFRVTTWTLINPLCFARLSDGTIYMGHGSGITEYTGYQDNGESYALKYYSNELDFGNAAILKFLKRLTMTIIGGQNTQASLKWGYDYASHFRAQTVVFPDSNTAEFGVSEYNVTTSEFAGGAVTNTPSVNSGGSGSVVKIGIEALIDGFEFSIQKIDILALLGRII